MSASGSGREAGRWWLAFVEAVKDDAVTPDIEDHGSVVVEAAAEMGTTVEQGG